MFFSHSIQSNQKIYLVSSSAKGNNIKEMVFAMIIYPNIVLQDAIGTAYLQEVIEGVVSAVREILIRICSKDHYILCPNERLRNVER